LIKREQDIPKLVWSKYLQLVWDFHSKNISLDRTDINKDGNFDVLDLGAVLKTTSKKDRH
jgi:hypothetical protein